MCAHAAQQTTFLPPKIPCYLSHTALSATQIETQMELQVFALSALEERMTHLETELLEMQGTVVRPSAQLSAHAPLRAR